MKQKNRWMALLLCASLLAGGCAAKGNQGEDSKQETPEKEPYQVKLDMIEPAAYGNAEGLELEPRSYISIIGKSGDGFFWEQVQEGVKKAEEDLNAQLGYEGKDKIKVTYSAPADADSVDEQVNLLDEELARYPIALGISVADEQACGVQFDLAADSGIPVVTFDSGSDYQGILADISTDNIGSAELVADKMAEQMDDAGEVVIFAHDSKSKTGKQRISGFQSKLEADHPNMAVVAVYTEDNLTTWQEQIAAELDAGTYTIEGPAKPTASDGEGTDPESITEEEIVDYILMKYPNAKGFYGTNADAVKTITESLERAQREDAVVMGYDADAEQLQMLESGEIDGLVVQNPFGMGYAAVIAAARAALEAGNEAYVDTGYMWVTLENVEDAQVKKFLSE